MINFRSSFSCLGEPIGCLVLIRFFFFFSFFIFMFCSLPFLMTIKHLFWKKGSYICVSAAGVCLK